MAYDFSKFKTHIKDSEEWLKKEFSNIRTGRASAAVLDGIKIESYGSFLSIQELGSITNEDVRCLRIVPWDMTQAKNIEKAIITSNTGVSVTVDDKGLRVIFPELTAERRVQITKAAKEKLEEAKKRIRGNRDDVMKDLQTKEKDGSLGKDDVFRHKTDAQKLVDEANKALDALYEKKEKEILN